MENMALGILAMHILEGMFFAGMAGSVVVVLTIFVRILWRSITQPEQRA